MTFYLFLTPDSPVKGLHGSGLFQSCPLKFGYTFTPCVGYFTSPCIYTPDRRENRLTVSPQKDYKNGVMAAVKFELASSRFSAK